MAAVRIACPLDCWDTCSLLVTVEDGQLRDVRGDPADPYTRGIVCPKARYQMERSLSEDRPLHPMLKVDGRWERVAWDVALDLLASRILLAVKDFGPSSVFYYHDSGSMGLSKSLGKRLFRRLGGTSEPLGSLCWAAGIKAQEYDLGYHLANAPDDVLNSQMAIIWGRNPAATNIHLVPFLREARKRGTHLTLVDPLRSPTAGIVDEHISPAPGTDAALALAMCNVILAERLADVPFIAAHTLGFSEFGRHVARLTPEWAAGVTGVAKETIVDFARRYAGSRPAAILMGYGFQRYYGGGNAVRACDALAAIAGNVGRSGGGANYACGWIARSLASLVPAPDPARPPRYIRRAALCDLSALRDPPVEVMVVAGANPVNQAPSAAGTRDAIASVPFKAVLDLRWTETCEVSDLFLPVASPFEDQDLYYCSWHQRLTYSERCVEPRGEALPDRVIWQKLAERLGFGRDFDRTMDQWVDEALGPVRKYDLSASAIRGKSVDFPGTPRVAYEDAAFLTPSGKFEFHSKRAQEDTAHAMATYLGPQDACSPAYPLRLLSPRELNHLHSQFYEKVLSPRGLPVAHIARRDLTDAGVTPGDPAVLESAHGRMDVETRESGDVPPGVALVYEGGSVLQGKGVNLLTAPGETDMGHGPAYYDCFVRIVRGPASG